MTAPSYTDKAYKIVRAGRAYVLQIFQLSPDHAPACVHWDRIKARDLSHVRGLLLSDGIRPLREETK